MNYQDFLKTKDCRWRGQNGFDVDDSKLSPHLFPYQRDIVKLALHAGRYAVFADTGLGKTPMLLEWAHHVCEHTGGKVLIFAPLAVGKQIERESSKFGIQGVTVTRDGSAPTRITITNYDNLEKYNPGDFVGVVLDESGILKAIDSSTRLALTARFSATRFRVCCTATPAPNDLMEITFHAVFLGIRQFNEIRALYFISDDGTTQRWRLKKHCVNDFWKWVASWAVALRKPSDMGYSDDGHILPPLHYVNHHIQTEFRNEGELFPMAALGLNEQRRAKRATLELRTGKVAEVVNASKEQWLIWCELNDESKALTAAIDGAVEVTGSDSNHHKEQSALDFIDGKIRVLVSKPSIFGFGMNFQNCHNIAFCGLTHSFEQTYQAVRRCWRFGQTKDVYAHLFVSDAEAGIADNIDYKQREHNKMFEEIVKRFNQRAKFEPVLHRTDKVEGDGWTMYLGDSAEVMKGLEENSIHHSVFSPPFPAMYAYTDSEADVGNSADLFELIDHLRFIMKPLFRVMVPGRVVSVHLTQSPLTMTKDGIVGRMDFRGHMIELMREVGFTYASEVTIDKNPQYVATRTKDRGLLFKSLATDSSVMTPCMADYLLFFRKPGKNPVPIRAGLSEKYRNPEGWITEQEWIEWAAPVWYREYVGSQFPGIRQTDTLNVVAARDANDELHLCPLQLGVIERSIKLFSAPGETILSPFAGIGSEGYQALQFKRKFIGIELKETYWNEARNNLSRAIQARSQLEIAV